MSIERFFGEFERIITYSVHWGFGSLLNSTIYAFFQGIYKYGCKEEPGRALDVRLILVNRSLAGSPRLVSLCLRKLIPLPTPSLLIGR